MARSLTTLFTVLPRRWVLFFAHLGLAALSNWVAFLLRFDEDIPAQQWELFAAMLPLLLTIRALTFYPFRLYDGLWRYTGLWDLRNLALSIAVSSLAFAGAVRFGLGTRAYPCLLYTSPSPRD